MAVKARIKAAWQKRRETDGFICDSRFPDKVQAVHGKWSKRRLAT